MGYLVLVTGAIMSLVGLYAIISGYPIIQIERGWTTVIAGSTMLTGGLVTLSVGLVLQTLLRIRTALETRPMASASEEIALAASENFEPIQNFEPVMRVEPRRAEVAPFTTGLEPLLAPDLMSPDFEARGFELPLDAHEKNQRHFDEPVPEHAEDRTHADFDEEAFSHALATPPSEPSQDVEPAYEPDHLDHYELQTPSTPEHDLAPSDETPPSPSKTEPPSRDDWLDQAFSSLDEELSLGPAQHHPEHDMPQHEAALHASVAEADHETAPHHEDEPAPHADHAEEDETPGADATEWAPPAPEVAVIGRYESDGTSYVMFADGSIEAQSEAGIYRFRSMAELKAFIEG